MSTGSGLQIFVQLISIESGWFKTDAHTMFCCSIMMDLPFISLPGNSVSEELELILPEDVIEGSARASVSVLGKTLGQIKELCNYKVFFLLCTTYNHP